MITIQLLKQMGFTRKGESSNIWIIGEELREVLGKTLKLPIIYYNIATQTCSVNRSEFCNLSRVCKDQKDIEKFVDCINFFFNLSVTLQIQPTYTKYTVRYAR